MKSLTSMQNGQGAICILLRICSVIRLQLCFSRRTLTFATYRKFSVTVQSRPLRFTPMLQWRNRKKYYLSSTHAIKSAYNCRILYYFNLAFSAFFVSRNPINGIKIGIKCFNCILSRFSTKINRFVLKYNYLV